VRVVATVPGSRSLVANVRTKDLGYTEKARVDAVLVPVIVTDRGQFVKGLRKTDFEVFEDGVAQPIAAVVSEDGPLDLVLAIDISGSMEHSLDDVKAAVRQLLTRLRPGDAATLIGFNDTPFIVAEREKDPQTRVKAVDLLSSWGGTALYDATVQALDLVSREWGRKGVIIFSDGDDRNSMTRRETAMARVQASDAMLYTVGFGMGATLPLLRTSLESYARSTGGRAFFPKSARELDGVFDDIVGELASQYVLSYSSTNLKQDSNWRNIKVQVRKGRYDVRARRGYRPQLPVRATAPVAERIVPAR
jgi:VWFA-related protein